MLQSLYPHLLALHNVLRWFALLAAAIAITFALSGWSGGRADNRALLRSGMPFIGIMDLQFLLGLILYFGASPLTQQATQDMAVAMRDSQMRFFAVEHTALMFGAVLLAHVGGALSRRARTPRRQHRGAAVCYALSFGLMLLGIPWWRPLLRAG